MKMQIDIELFKWIIDNKRVIIDVIDYIANNMPYNCNVVKLNTKDVAKYIPHTKSEQDKTENNVDLAIYDLIEHNVLTPLNKVLDSNSFCDCYVVNTSYISKTDSSNRIHN